jgi:glycosyltransferase involved in cell wall biosynthesis
VRILLVNWNDRDNPHAGGAEIHLHEIFGRLARAGHGVDLVASGWPGAAPAAEVGGIRVRRVGGRHSFALRARGAVRRALAGAAYDVVVEDINKVPLYLPTLTRLPFCALVPHLFGTTAFREASWPMAAVVWAAERPIPRVYRRAWFHAISDSTRDDLVRRGVPRDRIEVIYPGVDSGWFHPDPAVARAAAPTFLYVGRLKRYKGVDTALRALARARVTRGDVVLQVAGQGDDRPRLERLAAELGLAGAVRFLGFVSEQEKRRLMREAWAVVFPSPKEGWGISNVEAAACGTPAVASDSPGLRESVRHDDTGFLVPHGDAAALAGRMLALAADAGLVRRLGARAREFATGLTWEAAAHATESQLERIVHHGG